MRVVEGDESVGMAKTSARDASGTSIETKRSGKKRPRSSTETNDAVTIEGSTELTP